MLVLSRKQDQDIVIGDNIRVRVLKVKGNTIRLGIEAPRDVKILRGELASDAPQARVESGGDGEAEITLTFSSEGFSQEGSPSAEMNGSTSRSTSRSTSGNNTSRSKDRNTNRNMGLDRQRHEAPQSVLPFPRSSDFSPSSDNTKTTIIAREQAPAPLHHNRLKELVKNMTRNA